MTTVVAGTLASSFANGSTVDGYTLVTGDRILIKNQAAGSENGIYTVNASGAPTRSVDANSQSTLYGAAVFTVNGSTNAGKRFVCNNSGTITVGSTTITFVQFDGGISYSAGSGLTLSTTTFAIDTTVVTRKYSTLIGNGSLTSIAVTHSLNTTDVIVGIKEVSTQAIVYCEIFTTDVNTVTLTFSIAPTSNQYRVTVFG